MSEKDRAFVEKQFDDLADEYEGNLTELLAPYGGGLGTQKFAEYKIALVSKLLDKKPSKILDFGCGTGRDTEYIKKYFPKAEIFGCDISQESLKLAEKYLPANHLFQNETVEQITEKGTFDLVILSCVLHHIEPKERCYWINGLKAVLNDGGHIAVFEHNTKNPLTKAIILDDNNRVDDITWMLGHKELIDLLGGRIYWQGYTMFFPMRFPGVLTVERLLKWCPLGAQHCVISEKV